MSSKSYDWAGDDVTRILPALNERSPEVIIKHNKFGIQKGDQFGPSNTPIETPYSNSNSNTNRYHKGSFLSQQASSQNKPPTQNKIPIKPGTSLSINQENLDGFQSSRSRSGSLHPDTSDIEQVPEPHNNQRRSSFPKRNSPSLPMQPRTSPTESSVKKATMRIPGCDTLVTTGTAQKQHPYVPPYSHSSYTRSGRSTRSTNNPNVTVMNPVPSVRAVIAQQAGKPSESITVPPKQSRPRVPKPPSEPELIDLIDDDPVEPKYSEPFLAKHIFFGQYEYKSVDSLPPYIQIVEAHGISQIQFKFGLDEDKQEDIPFCNIKKYGMTLLDNSPNADSYIFFVTQEQKFKKVPCGTGHIFDPNARRGVLSKYLVMILDTQIAVNIHCFLQSIRYFKDKFADQKVDSMDYAMALNFYNSKKWEDPSNSQSLFRRAEIELARAKELEFPPDGGRVTRRRTSLQTSWGLNGGLTNVTKEDSRIYLVYPPELEATDAVTLSYGDLRRLNPGIYFNDNLIDLKIKHIIFSLPEEKRNKIHAFSCLFYAKLLEAKDPKAQHQLVSRWTKNVDLFEQEFILFPINYRLHWSLVVLARPKLWVEQRMKSPQTPSIDKKSKMEVDITDEDLAFQTTQSSGDENDGVYFANDEENIGCFLHLDSLGSYHPTQTIVKHLAQYILNEKEAKDKAKQLQQQQESKESEDKGGQNESKLTEDLNKTTITNVSDSDEDGDNEVSILTPANQKNSRLKKNTPTTTTPASSSLKLSANSKEKDFVKCVVPKQENGYDCGVFVIKFAEMVLEKWPTTTEKDIKECLKSQFSKVFTQETIHEERENIRTLLNDLREDWIKKNPQRVNETVKTEDTPSSSTPPVDGPGEEDPAQSSPLPVPYSSKKKLQEMEGNEPDKEGNEEGKEEEEEEELEKEMEVDGEDKEEMDDQEETQMESGNILTNKFSEKELKEMNERFLMKELLEQGIASDDLESFEKVKESKLQDDREDEEIEDQSETQETFHQTEIFEPPKPSKFKKPTPLISCMTSRSNVMMNPVLEIEDDIEEPDESSENDEKKQKKSKKHRKDKHKHKEKDHKKSKTLLELSFTQRTTDDSQEQANPTETSDGDSPDSHKRKRKEEEKSSSGNKKRRHSSSSHLKPIEIDHDDQIIDD